MIIKYVLPLAYQSLQTISMVGYQEVEHLRGVVTELREKTQVAEEKALEVDALRRELASVSCVSEREQKSFEKAARAQLSALKAENKKVASEVMALMQKLQETEDVVRVGTSCGQYLLVKNHKPCRFYI